MTGLTKVASTITEPRRQTLETTGAPPEGPGPRAERPASPARRHIPVPWHRLLLLAVLPVSVLLWLLSLRHVQLEGMGGWGLLPVLPILFWTALGLLTLGFAASVTRSWVHTGWLLGYVIALIGVLHATPILLEGGSLRYAWAWKHIAVIDYLQRHGGTDAPGTELAAYHQWPGFFGLNDQLLQLTGLNSALSYAAWAPVFNNLMMIAPLVLILRTMTRDRRILWGSIWIFYSCAWTGQDYFSPQAFAFTLFLTVIGIVLNRAAERPALEPEQPRRPRGPTLARVLLLLPLLAAVASSHQLTPLILILALALLATTSRYRTPVLLWTLAAATAFMLAWNSTVARPYISDNITSIVKSFGSLDANATAPLNGAAEASREQQIIAYVDTAAALLIALLAITAVILHRHLRRSSALLLVLAPLPMLVANDYGGEIIFRVYLFALPAAAFLNRELLTPRTRRTRRLHAVAFPAFLLLLVAVFVVPYYGKEAQNYFPRGELAATDYLYKTAPHGSVIVGASSDYPGGETDYEYYSQTAWLNNLTPAQRTLIEQDPLDALKDQLSGHDTPAYFILTTSQIAEIKAAGLLPAATLDQIEQIANTAPQFHVVYRNPDAVIITLDHPTAPATPHTPHQPGGTP